MKNFILAVCLGASAAPALAQHMIVGIDNKVYWDAEGKPVLIFTAADGSPLART